MNPRKRQGFTLIEMLVVTAILALLMAMISPALNRALENSRRVACTANLRSLGQATLAYAVDHQQRIPFQRAASGPGSGYANPPWFNLLAPYAGAEIRSAISLEPGTDKVFRCPAQRGSFAVSYGPSSGAFLDDNSFLRYDLIDQPSRKVWLLDVHTGFVYFFNPALPSELWASDRHAGRVNVLYFDGHVSQASLTELEAERPLLFQPTR